MNQEDDSTSAAAKTSRCCPDRYCPDECSADQRSPEDVGADGGSAVGGSADDGHANDGHADKYRAVYEQRVHAAMDYIEANIAGDLKLDTVANAAQFSPFHFHRVFTAFTGQTIAQFASRIRIERAAALLLRHPNRTISQIGADCGFATPSAFSRSFKARYSTTPKGWRDRSGVRVEGEDIASPDEQHKSERRYAVVTETDPGRVWNLAHPNLRAASVAIEHLEEVDVVYVRSTGSYAGSGELFARLFGQVREWAHTVRLDPDATSHFALYHDAPDITDEELLRVSACMQIPRSVSPEAPMGRLSLASGRYAIARFELGVADYGEAWQAVLGDWLPASGFEPSDGVFFERFPPNGTEARHAMSDTEHHGAPQIEQAQDSQQTERHNVEICVPVRRLGVGGTR